MTPIDSTTLMRLPREPYPGLRPFLDFEAALLFGRDRQVREVIERLAQTQFVAVLGGSGSGKSSLIHAGVTPALRSYGIPGAGDLWLPMVCTPGTNVGAEDSAARRHSPVTRLARRFAALLRPAADAQAEAQRLAGIAEVFRQEAGFARLLEAYGMELAVPPGPDPAEARVLFVLDQFEEIFHPTNKGVADAEVLVERVLDHFFAPHPRCYVVLTMRSEHLNDCASFLELPDAINKSSYLVRRLDDDELREAIVAPAQRFLRLVARNRHDDGRLPERVEFEPAVIERLLRDVSAIKNDPDHLPLLQHMLARLWQAALEREEMDMPVPARIGGLDLIRAVNAGAQGDDRPLPESLNTLRECVHNWPEKIYLWHDPPQRAQFDMLLRRLTYKDPNTGLYSQQHIEVDAGARLLGPGCTREQLRALLNEGFLGSVDYLYWDDDDPARVTLKVSHESFIRGWLRLRALIDQQSTQFDEYRSVLLRCAEWVDGQHDADFLLETAHLRRLKASGFMARLAGAEPREAWSRLLTLDREAARLQPHAAALDTYVARSRARQRRRAALRMLAPFGVAALVLAGLGLAGIFTSLVQSPTMRRAELLLDANAQAKAASIGPSFASQGASDQALVTLLRAAADVDGARSGEGTRLGAISAWLIDKLQTVDLVRRQSEFLAGVLVQSEPLVNERLRGLLTGAIWAVPALPAGAPSPAPRRLEASCALTQAGEAGTLRGRVYVSVATRTGAANQRRALFVPQRGADADLLAYAAGWDETSGLCKAGELALRLPAALQSHAVFDAALRYFAYSVDAGSEEPPAVIMQEMNWGLRDNGEPLALYREAVTVRTDRKLVERVRATAGVERAVPVPTWAVNGGRVIDIGGQGWRIVATQARRLGNEAGAGALRAIEPAGEGTPCDVLARSLVGVAGRRSQMLDADALCLAVHKVGTDLGSVESGSDGWRDEFRVWVYPRPSAGALERLGQRPQAPIAVVAPFARVAQASGDGAGWAIGESGLHQGWLALRTRSAAGAESVIGLPLTTCALWRLGREVLTAEVDAATRPHARVCERD